MNIIQVSVESIGAKLNIEQDAAHEFVISTQQVAKGFGVPSSTIQSVKERHKKDLTEGKHFIVRHTPPNAFSGKLPQKEILWTKRGVVRLGFLIKSKRAVAFRDWAEDLIIRYSERDTVIARNLLNVPRVWQKTFPDAFFAGVMKIYGYDFDRKVGTPSFVGGFINKHIYTYLWKSLPEAMKAKRKEFATETDEDLYKLHQFLEANAAETLRTHLGLVQGLLNAATDAPMFDALFFRACVNPDQLTLEFNPKRAHKTREVAQ